MSERLYLDKKGSAKSNPRPFTSRKRKHYPLNRYLMEAEKASTSASAKKLRKSEDIDIEVDATFGYRIVNYVTVFAAIGAAVKCKKCDGNVNFSESSIRGLGFKVKMSCVSCEPVYVNSSPLIDRNAYEINRRIVFAFRLLGIGLAGIEKFCGIMDLPKPVFHSFYDKIVQNIHFAVKSVCKLSMKNAVNSEKKINTQKGDSEGLTVSGDGTWRKRGFSSLFGVSTVIANYTGKVIDAIIKSRYCKSCEFWEKFNGTEEYYEWKTDHEAECLANHEGSAGKMEVDAITEIFARSEEQY